MYNSNSNLGLLFAQNDQKDYKFYRHQWKNLHDFLGLGTCEKTGMERVKWD